MRTIDFTCPCGNRLRALVLGDGDEPVQFFLRTTRIASTPNPKGANVVAESFREITNCPNCLRNLAAVSATEFLESVWS